MPRHNRVDPWGDLHATAERGLFTGNRGCVVDADEKVVRHHGSRLWITCVLQFRGWRWPLARPRRWTPLFFLDDAVALAAGHRPCATCRLSHYRAYRDAVARSNGSAAVPLASQLNDRLHVERLPPGRGLHRAQQRRLWPCDIAGLPDGAVFVAASGGARLVLGASTLRFGFGGWCDRRPRPPLGTVEVLTPPTSLAALAHGFMPVLHPSVA